MSIYGTKEIVKKIIGDCNSHISSHLVGLTDEQDIQLVNFTEKLLTQSLGELMTNLVQTTDHNERLLIMTVIVDILDLDELNEDVERFKLLAKQDEYKKLLQEVVKLTDEGHFKRQS